MTGAQPGPQHQHTGAGEHYTRELQGRTVRLIRCEDAHTHLLPGITGVVLLVDGAGTVHVLWENGHRLGLIPGIDSWEVVDA